MIIVEQMVGGVCGSRDLVNSRPRSVSVAHNSALHNYVTTEGATGYAQCINPLQQKVVRVMHTS